MPQIANFDKSVAYFPFATDLSNLSALGGAYTASGNVAVSADANSPSGYSASFDGTGDYVLVPNIELGSQDLEIFLRVTTTSTTVNSALVAKDSGSFASGAWTLIFNHNSANGRLALYVQNFNSGAPLLEMTSGTIADGNVHEIVVSRSGSAWKLIVDGVVAASATWAGSVSVADSLFTTLGKQTGYSRDFSGRMWDFLFLVGAANHTGAYTVDSTATSYAISNAGTTAIKDADGNAAARVVCALPRMAINRAYATTSSGSGTYSLLVPDIAVGYDVLILDNSVSPLDDIIVRNVGRA